MELNTLFPRMKRTQYEWINNFTCIFTIIESTVWRHFLTVMPNHHWYNACKIRIITRDVLDVWFSTYAEADFIFQYPRMRVSKFWKSKWRKYNSKRTFKKHSDLVSKINQNFLRSLLPMTTGEHQFLKKLH